MSAETEMTLFRQPTAPYLRGLSTTSPPNIFVEVLALSDTSNGSTYFPGRASKDLNSVDEGAAVQSNWFGTLE
jgi:hypothetical protein